MGTNAIMLATGRIFGLDSQLLFDILFQGIAVFILFLFVGYLLINPVRNALKKRQDKVENDRKSAEQDKLAAAELKTQYDAKLAGVEQEKLEILSEARRKAVKNENAIIDGAKEEAARIRASAEREAALEKEKVREEVRTEIIGVASAMAGKLIASEITPEKQEQLLQETLDEIGDETWQNK